MNAAKGHEKIFRDDPKEDSRNQPYERRFDEPKYLNYRIIVSSLDDKVSRETLEDKFNKYGKVLGVSQHRGGAYIQYEQEAAAIAAIKDVHNSTYRGSKLDARFVKDSSGHEEKTRFLISQRQRISPIKRPIWRDSVCAFCMPLYMEFGRDYPPRDGNYRPAYRDRSPQRIGRENNEPYPRDGDTSQRRSEDRFREGATAPKVEAKKPFISIPYERNLEQPNSQALPYKSRNTADFVESAIQGSVQSPQANDCEIIVCNPMLSDYAESIEWRLKTMGMKVDILFPKEGSPILQILEDISMRRCLYALVVNNQNELHKSVTVNILYGKPQEHRNMPLEDAMLLISRNFDNYKREKVTGTAAVPRDILGAGGGAIGSPNETQLLFRMLADGKQLTITELDRAISHLQECRDRLIAVERRVPLATPVDIGSVSETLLQHVDKLQASGFQEKILGMISSQPAPARTPTNQTGNSYNNRSENVSNNWGNVSRAVGATGNGQTDASPTSNTPFINFDNPNIKKALDSLIQSGPNLLRSIGAATGGPNTGQANDPYRNTQMFSPAQQQGGNMGGGPGSRLANQNPDPFFNQTNYQRQFY